MSSLVKTIPFGQGATLDVIALEKKIALQVNQHTGAGLFFSTHLTPGQARQLAAHLIECADAVDLEKDRA